MPVLVRDPQSEVSRIFMEIASNLAGQLSVASERAKKAQGLKIISS
jgi:MinD-like ATPase involved in chromosome partitioning or flagellar assembly